MNELGEMKKDGVSIAGMMAGGGGSTYHLPPATDSTLGGIKVGSGLSITNDGTLSATGGGGGGGGGFDFSTEEFDTGHKWIDGKTIYGKVIANFSISSGTSVNVYPGINYDTLINAFACCRDTSDSKAYIYHSWGFSTYTTDKSWVQFRFADNVRVGVYAIFYYTK